MRRARILIVDDYAPLRIALGAILRRYGYNVATAGLGSEALEVLEREGTDIHLILTDLTMPGMSGRELFVAARARRPDLPIIAMTGFTDDEAALHLISTGELPCLSNPLGTRSSLPW